MATYLGRRGVGTWSYPEERPKDMLGYTYKLWPDISQIVNVLGRQLGAGDVVRDPHYACWDEPLPDMAFTVNGAVADGVSVIVFDAPGVTPCKGLKAGDMLYDETSDEIVIVESNPTAPYLSVAVTRHVGGTNPGAAIANDSVLRWCGSAYGDGSRAPMAVSQNPTSVWNYLHTEKETCEVDWMADEMTTRPVKSYTQLKEEALMRLKIKMESALFWSVASEGTDGEGNRRSTMNGLNALITTNRDDYTSTGVSKDDLDDAFAEIFRYGERRERFAAGGMGAMLTLNRIFETHSVSNWQVTDRVTKVGGMALKSYMHPFGTLHFAMSQLLSESAVWTYDLFVVDPLCARMVKSPSGAPKFHDNVGDPDRDARKGYWRSVFGLRLGQEKRHGLLRGLANIRY